VDAYADSDENEFHIRHHEVDRTTVPDDLVDYLFAHMYALINHLHLALR
jgi:hypothetical protein